MMIGILHEGENDYVPLRILVKKILESRLGLTPRNLNFTGFCSNGTTPDKLRAACVQFLDAPLIKNPRVDFIIFHSDLNGDLTEKAARITLRDEYQRERPGALIAAAFPDPHLEQWFFSEVDALCTYFNIDAGQLATVIGKDPKARLKNLIRSLSDITLRTDEIYSEISESLDVDKLASRDSHFQYFVNDLMRTYNEWSRK